MPVNIGRGLNVAVSHPFLNIFQAASLIQQETCTAMPQFVKTNMRQVVLLEDFQKMVRHIVRFKRCTVRPFEDVVILFVGAAELPAVFFLLCFMLRASGVSGKLRRLLCVLVLSFSMRVIILQTVCRISRQLLSKSTLSHFRPSTSLRRRPYSAVILTSGSIGSSFITSNSFCSCSAL